MDKEEIIISKLSRIVSICEHIDNVCSEIRKNFLIEDLDLHIEEIESSLQKITINLNMIQQEVEK